MARINKQEVLQEMQEGLKLDTAREQTPSELAEKILPTYTVNPKPRIILVVDTTANDSDKSFTVPTGKKWKLLYGHIDFTTDANVANREMRLLFKDSNNNSLYEVRALNVQTASKTERYNLGQFSEPTEPTDGNHYFPIPVNSVFIEDFVIKIVAVLGQAGDDMTIRLFIEESNMNPQR